MSDTTSFLKQVRPSIGDMRQIAGVFDYVDPSCGLRGWLVHPSIEALPLRVEAWCEGRRLAASVTILERPDIDKVLKRNTWCGFLIGWSRFDRAALKKLAEDSPEAEISVHAAGAGLKLSTTFGSLTAREAQRMLLGAPRGDHRAEFAQLNDWLEIEESGLFDPFWYFRAYGADAELQRPALLHYIQTGEGLGNRPNLYFDPAYYAAQAGIGAEDRALLHYIRRQHGTRQLPSPHFDNAWYRGTYGVGSTMAALAHYLNHRPHFLPNALVDAEMVPRRRGAEDPYESFLRDLVRSKDLRARLGDSPQGLAIRQDADRLFGNWTEESAPPVEAAAPPPAPGLASLDDLVALTGDGGGDSPAAALVRAADALRRDLAAEAARALTGGLPAIASPDLLHQLLDWAHSVWSPALRPDLVPLLQALRKQGVHDALSMLRLLEWAVDSRDVIAASAAADDLLQHHPGAERGWVLVTLARCRQLQGEPARAIAKLRRIEAPDDDHLTGVAIGLMIELGDVQAAAERLKALGERTSPEILQARIRLAVHGRDHAGLARLLADADGSAVAAWVLCEATYRLVQPGIVPEADQIAAEDRLAEALAMHPAENALMARMHILLQRRKFVALERLFAQIEGSDIAATDNMTIRRLEFLGLTGRTDEALALYRARLSGTTFGKWEGMSVLRLLGEAKQWAEAGTVILSHIGQGFGFGGAQHQAMRVVRKAGLHAKIAELASSGQIGAPEPELRRFLMLVQEDHTLVQSAKALSGHGMVPARSLKGMNGNWILSEGAVSDDETGCLFLCTNRRYFLSLLTFLCSFFGQSQQSTAHVFVFLDRDVPRSWHSTVTMVAARFSRVIEIVHEDQFMPKGVEHKAEYGFFAGGSGLSRAAYFRLYAARHLMAMDRFTRALYVDTDIVCRGDLTDLLARDLRGAAIAARIEDFGPEVKAAAERNDLDPHRYFNSGVLVFDFAHAALAGLLGHAIQLSETETDRLVFHDQCALNIAFTGSFQPLEPQWNFFLRPHRERNGHIEDGMLLHYLDKPKPWDIVFSRNYREEWRVWAVHLGLILPQPAYIDIFAAANEE